MTETPKQNKTIFQTIAEPLLDGQIKLNDDWPTKDNFILYVVTGFSGIFIALFVWTIFKIRKLSAGLLVVERVQNARALSFTTQRLNQVKNLAPSAFQLKWLGIKQIS